MPAEADPRALTVLRSALASSSRATRLRAVAMLAHVSCEERGQWLERALSDTDEGVRSTARLVCAWVTQPADPPWPRREDPAFDVRAQPVAPELALEAATGLRWEWEYAVEVWRNDGLLVGVFLAATCQDDDEHARRIALGQAVLASASPHGERFDPEQAAAFVVAKRRVQRDPRPRSR